MWKNAGVLLLIASLVFGWLKTHDHYVRADALAVARRDSLFYADKVIKRANDKLTDTQVELALTRVDLTVAKNALVAKRATLVKVQGMDEFELAHWKKKVLDSLHVDIVDSLVNKYDNLVLVLKAQVIVAESMERNEMKQKFIADSNTVLEVMKRKAIENMNAGLIKELGSIKKGPSLGKIITNYILPTVALTYGVVKVTEHGR
jgi:hypothetical protein